MSEKLRGELPTLLGKPLSDVELEILKLLSQGYNYPEITDIRKRCLQTVKNEGLRLMQKLGACTAAHAVAIAKDKGLI